MPAAWGFHTTQQPCGVCAPVFRGGEQALADWNSSSHGVCLGIQDSTARVVTLESDMCLSDSKGHPSALRAPLFTVVFIGPCHCQILCSAPDPRVTQTVTLLLPWSCGERSGHCGGWSRGSPGPDFLLCSLRWGCGGQRWQVPRCFQHGTLQWEISCSLPRGGVGGGGSRWQCWAAAAFCPANLRAGYVPGIVVVVIVFEYRIGRLFRAEKSVSRPSIKGLTPLGEQWGIWLLS